MTFSDYIILQQSEKFYFDSLIQTAKCKTTLENWFPDLYFEYIELQRVYDLNRFVDFLNNYSITSQYETLQRGIINLYLKYDQEIDTHS